MRAAAALLLALGVGLPARAGTDAFTSNGPYGGRVERLLISPPRPSRLYAEVGGARYRSDDFATTWKEIPAPALLRPDPSHPDVVYSPFQTSTDAGETWSPAPSCPIVYPSNPGPPCGFQSLTDLAVDRRDPSVRVVSTGFCMFAGCTGAIYRSTDGGRTWPTSGGAGYHDSIVADPSDASVLYSISYSRFGGSVRTAVVKSADGGISWRTVHESTVNGAIQALALDPRSPSTVTIGGSQGVLRSPDGGLTWSPLTGSGPVSRLAVDAESHLYAASPNGLLSGLEWRSTGLTPDAFPSSQVEAITPHPFDPRILYAAGAPYGVLRSDDWGASFQVASRGLRGTSFGALTIGGAADAATLYAGSELVFRSDDAGGSWRLLTAPPQSSRAVSIAVHPRLPDVVYLAASTQAPPLYGSISRSTDGGRTFRVVLGGILDMKQVLLDPAAPSTVYAVAGALHRSTDSGDTWTQVPVPAADVLTTDASGRALYAGSGLGLHASTDAGATWRRLENGLPTGLVVTAVLENRGSVYAAGSVPDGGPGVYRSVDEGASWQPLTSGLSTGSNVTIAQLLQDPARPGVLYAATSMGVLAYTGGSWQMLAEGLGGATVSALAYDPSTSTLHAAAKGIFSRNTSSLVPANPLPSPSFLQPAADAAGNGPFELRIRGAGFVEASEALWNGSPRATTYVSQGELAVAVRAADIAAAGQAAVSVRNPAPGGGVSAALAFTVLAAFPPATVSRLSPPSALTGTAGLELHVLGTGFVFRSQVLWNGEPRPTRQLSGSELVATLAPADLSTPRSVAVSVFTPGGGTTPALAFRVEGHTADRLLPIVLDVVGRNGSRYTSELVLVNRSTSAAVVELAYRPARSLSGEGGGAMTQLLPALSQVVIPDALENLRRGGLPIPTSGSQGGTLRATFRDLAEKDAAHALVRTTTPSGEGFAGVAMPGLSPADLFTESAWVFGLRETESDRSNLALVNAGDAGSVTLRVTLVKGDGSARATLPDLTLEPGEWAQLTSVLAGARFDEGWAQVERVEGEAPFFTYGVVNDAVTNDGSVLSGVAEVGGSATVPVLVETPRFESELVLANPSDVPAPVTLVFDEALTGGWSARLEVTLAPREQRLVPRAVDLLRREGTPRNGAPGPRGGSYAGALLVCPRSEGPGCPVYAAARTATVAGPGAYGVFTPPVAEPARHEAWVFGLRHDETARSNLALSSAGRQEVTVELYAGEGGRRLATLGPFQLDSSWMQLHSPLSPYGVSHGWARVVGLAGDGGFVAYGVVNDRGTDDGTYLPMEIGHTP